MYIMVIVGCMVVMDGCNKQSSATSNDSNQSCDSTSSHMVASIEVEPSIEVDSAAERFVYLYDRNQFLFKYDSLQDIEEFRREIDTPFSFSKTNPDDLIIFCATSHSASMLYSVEFWLNEIPEILTSDGLKELLDYSENVPFNIRRGFVNMFCDMVNSLWIDSIRTENHNQDGPLSAEDSLIFIKKYPFVPSLIEDLNQPQGTLQEIELDEYTLTDENIEKLFVNEIFKHLYMNPTCYLYLSQEINEGRTELKCTYYDKTATPGEINPIGISFIKNNYYDIGLGDADEAIIVDQTVKEYFQREDSSKVKFSYYSYPDSTKDYWPYRLRFIKNDTSWQCLRNRGLLPPVE